MVQAAWRGCEETKIRVWQRCIATMVGGSVGTSHPLQLLSALCLAPLNKHPDLTRIICSILNNASVALCNSIIGCTRSRLSLAYPPTQLNPPSPNLVYPAQLSVAPPPNSTACHQPPPPYLSFSSPPTSPLPLLHPSPPYLSFTPPPPHSAPHPPPPSPAASHLYALAVVSASKITPRCRPCYGSFGHLAAVLDLARPLVVESDARMMAAVSTQPMVQSPPWSCTDWKLTVQPQAEAPRV
ncbi:hypothetical protein HaLaN_21067 [Haematococcus lacustris]|uniref:Uncharacterized protein n=1 Tax=Haematococcus lacustris TaxID=44745 RepID=A0A699ZLA8_HAELA|nr:hypothetical protein HaLaN_21067 [Haematococcus lacustris]